ncbi:MAG: class I SAM-dependent DNA methyltransferase, partial [Candidatus Hodarchaeota archaeon]
MPPKFDNSLSRAFVPFSLIPVLPITEQLHIVQSAFDTLESMDTSQQKFFAKTISQVKENKIEEIFSTIQPIGKNLWKYHNYYFIYSPELVDHDLFMEKKGLIILKEIKRALLLKTIKWVCLINQKTIYIFTLSNNGFLLWSPILQGIVPYFLASILADNTILDSIDDSWRWSFLEKEKSQLLKFVNKKFKNLQILGNKESIFSCFNFLMSSLLKTKEKLIACINKELTLIPFSDDYKNLLRIRFLFQKIFNQQYDLSFESFLEPSEPNAWKEIFNNFPFTEYQWILDVPPILILEILPQIKSIGDYQKFGEYYTPIALAETIVTRSFKTYIDQDLTKPITSLRVFDPAMGTGILLVFAMEWLVNFIILNTSNDSFINLRRKIVYSCLNGVDIDENSISICNNYLRSFYLLEMENKKLQIGLEQKDFIDSFVTNMKCKQTFPKFDIILSNPPYLAFHSRFTKNFPSKVELKILRQLLPVFSGKRDNTYLIFLGICLQQFLATKGVAGFVIDHSFLDLPSYKEIREFLLSNYHIGYILANYSYRKTAIVDLSLIVLQKTQNVQPTLWQENLLDETRKIPKEHFLLQTNFIFQYQENLTFLSHLDAITVPLGSITSSSCGLEYGALLKTHFLSSNAKKGFYKCIDGSNGLSHPYILF